jgi:uncharacterized membrane protein (UPF0127 family)
MSLATVARATDGSVMCASCFVADTPLTRLRGLLGRRSLPSGCRGARQTLELAGGEAEGRGIAPGQRLEIHSAEGG